MRGVQFAQPPSSVTSAQSVQGRGVQGQPPPQRLGPDHEPEEELEDEELEDDDEPLLDELELLEEPLLELLVPPSQSQQPAWWLKSQGPSSFVSAPSTIRSVIARV